MKIENSGLDSVKIPLGAHVPDPPRYLASSSYGPRAWAWRAGRRCSGLKACGVHRRPVRNRRGLGSQLKRCRTFHIWWHGPVGSPGARASSRTAQTPLRVKFAKNLADRKKGKRRQPWWS